MNTTWKSPTIITGPPATGLYYFHRPEIVNTIILKLKKGSHILIAAPRRVGKTSIMQYMETHPEAGYKMIFRNIQSVSSEQEFYKILYELIISSLSSLTQFRAWLKKYIKSKKIIEIDITGNIKIDDKNIDYLYEIKHEIIPFLEKNNETIVLILDELPEVLHNLYKNGNTQEASHILDVLRIWGQEKIYNKIRIITSGSVGIHHIVKLIEGRISDLNSYVKVEYEPFTPDIAVQYIKWATEGATVQYDEELMAGLLNKVKYYVPFFINILLDKTDSIAQKNNNPTITLQDIDTAFEQAVSYSEYFDDWKLRLKQYFPAQEYHFLMDILIYTAHHTIIQIQKIYDIAVKHQLHLDYMELMNGLENDGYLVAFEKGNYRFISPLLQEFWKRNHPLL